MTRRKFYCLSVMLIAWAILVLCLWDFVSAFSKLFDIHTEPYRLEEELDRIYDNMQTKVVFSTRAPVGTDKAEKGSFWWRTDTNQLLIRSNTTWISVTN